MANQAATPRPANMEAGLIIGNGEGSLVRRPSGVIVPAELGNRPVPGAPSNGSVTRDLDGRRRVVYPDSERRVIDKAINLLRAQGIGYIVGCIGAYGPPDDRREASGGNGYHRDGSLACGQPMRPEGVGTPDAGFGCNCTRIHFLRTEAGRR